MLCEGQNVAMEPSMKDTGIGDAACFNKGYRKKNEKIEAVKQGQKTKAVK